MVIIQGRSIDGQSDHFTDVTTAFPLSFAGESHCGHEMVLVRLKASLETRTPPKLVMMYIIRVINFKPILGIEVN